MLQINISNGKINKDPTIIIKEDPSISKGKEDATTCHMLKEKGS
jgi:hypothetical protein